MTLRFLHRLCAYAMTAAILSSLACGRNNGHDSTLDAPSAQNLHYDMIVELAPELHTLRGSQTVTFPAEEHVQISMSNGARLESVKGSTHTDVLDYVESTRGGEDNDRQWNVTLTNRSEVAELHISWEATFYQDHTSGERAGEIHNFEMRRSIGEEGIYLTGAWYPIIDAHSMSTYRVSVNRMQSTEIVVSGYQSGESSDERTVWKSSYPVRGITIVGGPHEVQNYVHDGLEIALHLKPSQSQHAAGLAEAVSGYLDRYEPLLGPYPAKQYRVVDNFFSSGFAFPGFTLLSSVVIDMGERSQTTHGYIDHEFVHSWYGNAIQVDDEGGNWCEALTSHLTNHYGHVLDGNEEGARGYRRNAINAFSRLSDQSDLPLATFGQEGGANRTIGYNKGAMVFHMLSMELGEEDFFAALRLLNDRYVGRVVGWSELQDVFEESGNCDLTNFFTQWVYGSGALTLDVSGVTWDRQSETLSVALNAPIGFQAKVPALVSFESGMRDSVTASVRADSTLIQYQNIPSMPATIELDPGYDLFRNVLRVDWLPTTNATRRGDQLVVLVSADQSQQLGPYINVFRDSYEDGQVSIHSDLSEAPVGWNDSAVLVLGDACSSDAVKSILAEMELDLRFDEGSFSIDGEEFSGGEQSLLLTGRHPNLPGVGVTFITGNSDEAYPKPMNVIPFYPNSMVVFEGGRPIHRKDFEKRLIFDVNGEQ